MAIVDDWTDPTTLEVGVDDLGRAPWANAVAGNFAYLAAPPMVQTLRSGTSFVSPGNQNALLWDSVAWDTTGGQMWDSGSAAAIVIPRSGVYTLSCAVRFDAPTSTLSKFAVHAAYNGDPTRWVKTHWGKQTETFALHVPGVWLVEDDSIEFEFANASDVDVTIERLGTRATVMWQANPDDVDDPDASDGSS